MEYSGRNEDLLNTPQRKVGTPNLKHSTISRSGGINKALLTPCRRIGLKRKSHISGASLRLCSPDSIRENVQESSPSPYGTETVSPIDENLVEDYSKNYETPKRQMLRRKANHVGSPMKPLSTITKPKVLSPNNTLEINPVITPHSESKKQSVSADVTTATAVNLHCTSSEDWTQQMLHSLQQRVKEKEEKLNALKLAELYRKKHDLEQLSELISTWREACQEALRQLLLTLAEHGHQLTMSELLAHLGIPHSLLNYSVEDEDFG